jgi:tRNA-specific 2-thiouridylase
MMEAAGASVRPGEGGGGVLVAFDEPQFAPAPGQAAVLYEGDLVLGGGTIAESF